MARQIYRKSLLERMSSPDQLDKMIQVTSPSFWMALVGGAIIVVAVLIWSILGRLPIKLSATGIFVPDQGAYTLATDSSGIVSSVEVEPGDTVEVGDVLLVLADTDLQNELGSLLDRRAKVEAVTLDSTGDIITADNRDLINIKTQLSSVGLESAQQQAILEMYKSDLEQLLPKLDTAERRMELAKDDYYEYIRNNSNSDLELRYSELSAKKSQIDSMYASQVANRDTALYSYQISLENVLESTGETLSVYLENFDELSQGSPDDPPTIAFAGGAIRFSKEQLTELQDTIDEVDLSTRPRDLDSSITNFLTGTNGSIDTLMSQLESLWYQYEVTQKTLDESVPDYDEVIAEYEKVKKEYEAYVAGNAEHNTEKERITALYQEYTNDYQTLFAQKNNLEANIASLEGQLKASQIGSGVQSSGLKEQFTSARAAILNSLDNEIAKYDYAINKTQVKATVSGEVSSLKVGIGSAVGQGSEIATIRRLSEDNLIVCYIPIAAGKKVEPGMKAIVCPTTISQQEYGHMEAEVIAVDSFVASATDIRSTLGDDMLAQAFTQSGPVVGVTCRLRTDETTASGYWWSNRKGANLMVPEGTMVTADIVTEEKAPISMLIPYIKEKFSTAMKPDPNANGGGR